MPTRCLSKLSDLKLFVFAVSKVTLSKKVNSYLLKSKPILISVMTQEKAGSKPETGQKME